MSEERVILTDYAEEMQQSYIDYAMSVIISRALPDVRDGLKPVHRRILYSMFTQGITPDKEYRKCAATVGDCLGRFHPHGDVSVYDAMVRMAQDFSLYLPLIDGHGNFGSIDGDPAAAYRYTESRLSQNAMHMLGDLDKKVVDFVPNFDEREEEPVVLPALLPNLLINGVEGIAVGMATSIPPHNPAETINAILEYVDNPNITTQKLMKFIKGPDFPTGGIICNPEVLTEIYEAGTSNPEKNGDKGKRNAIRIRSKIEIESLSNGKTNVVVTEIPFTWSGSKMRLIKEITDQVKKGELNEVSDVFDESGKEGTRLVIEVKKNVDINNFVNKLFKKTHLEDTLSVNFLALVPDKKNKSKLLPKVLGLKEIIEHYVNFQKELILRKYKYLLPKELEKKEIFEGLIKAIDVLDTIIEALRGSKDIKRVKQCLMSGATDGIVFRTKRAEKEAKTFNFTEVQTNAIFDMKLQRLVGLEIQKLKNDYDLTLKNIARYEDIIENDSSLINVLKTNLLELRKKYPVKRKTVLQEVALPEYVEEVKEVDLSILIDKFGYVKAVETSTLAKASDDVYKEYINVFSAKNTDKLCLFTDSGNLFQIKMTEIPKVKLKDKGVPLENLAKYGKQNIVYIDVYSVIQSSRVLISTKKGLIKNTSGQEFETIRSQIAYTKLDEGDVVADINILSTDKYVEISKFKNITSKAILVAMITQKGYCLKFNITEVPDLKKTSKGIKGIQMSGEDVVEKVLLIKNGESTVEMVCGKEIDLAKIKIKKHNQIGFKV